MSPKWRGEFSVKGEVTELYTHAVSKAQARVHLKRQLDKKYDRRVYPDDEKITQVPDDK